jgi:HEAT repeat protein
MSNYKTMTEAPDPPRDPRLSPLFEEDADVVARSCIDLVTIAFEDPELELEMIDLLQRNIDRKEGFSTGEFCIALVLGEIHSTPSTTVIIQCLHAEEDEMIQRIAVRSLQRIGGPAFDAILELLEDPEINGEAAAMAIESLEGIGLHQLPQHRENIIERLRIDLVNNKLPILRREAAAIALARLGISEVAETIELLLEREFKNGNVFITEALDLMSEYPDGTPGHTEDPIEQVVRWISDDILPGGELDLSMIKMEESDPEQT